MTSLDETEENCDELMETINKTMQRVMQIQKAKEASYDAKMKEFDELCTNKTIQIEIEKAEWEREKELIAKTQHFQSCVKLDVGGTHFSTSVTTLCRFPDSMLGAMFSGRHVMCKNADGFHFIDRDGTHFRHILNFLRSPEDFVCDLNPSLKEELRREVKYYGLDEYMFPFVPAADSIPETTQAPPPFGGFGGIAAPVVFQFGGATTTAAAPSEAPFGGGFYFGVKPVAAPQPPISSIAPVAFGGKRRAAAAPVSTTGEFTFGRPTATSSTGSAVSTYTFRGPAKAPAAASFSTGFSVGGACIAPVASSTATTSRGYNFGSAVEPVSASSISVTVKSTLPSATEYAKDLDLDEDEAEDVQTEMDNARQAWTAVVGKCDSTMVASSECGEDGVFDRLMSRLGTTFSAEEHGEKLTALRSADGTMTSDAFVDWYVRWLYKSVGSDAGDEEEAEQQSASGDGKGWSNVKWSVAPVLSGASSDGGWKCTTCSVMNGASQAVCVCCASLPR